MTCILSKLPESSDAVNNYTGRNTVLKSNYKYGRIKDIIENRENHLKN